MLLRYRTGTYYSQPFIVSTAKGAVVDLPSNASESAQTFRAISGQSASYYHPALTISQAQSKINAGTPFDLTLTWSGGGGHAVVCSGYNGSSLQIIDPGANCVTDYFEYSKMIDNCNFKSGNGRWTEGFC